MLGNFDGLHIGHQKLIEFLNTTLESSYGPKFRKAAISFYPHPRSILVKDEILRDEYSRLLTPIRARQKYFELYNIDELVLVRFSKSFAEISPQEFIENVVYPLRPSLVVVGTDWRFGKGREGNIETLISLGKQYGFEAKVVPLFEGKSNSGQKIGASVVRKLLSESKVGEVEEILGRKFSVIGRVIRGDGRGKSIGFATANINSNRQFYPKYGVYKTRINIDGEVYNSISNVGVRPTFHGNLRKHNLETHIFEFNKDIYGKIVEVEFVDWVRDEKKFTSISELVSQIGEDIKHVKSS